MSFGFEVYSNSGICLDKNTRITAILDYFYISAGSSGSRALDMEGKNCVAFFLPGDEAPLIYIKPPLITLSNTHVSWSVPDISHIPANVWWDSVKGYIVVAEVGGLAAEEGHGLEFLDDTGKGVLGSDHTNFVVLDKGSMSNTRNRSGTTGNPYGDYSLWEVTFPEPIPVSVPLLTGICTSSGRVGETLLQTDSSNTHFIKLQYQVTKGSESWVDYILAVPDVPGDPAGSGFGLEIYDSSGKVTFEPGKPYIHIGAINTFNMPADISSTLSVSRLSGYSSDDRWYCCSISSNQTLLGHKWYRPVFYGDYLKGVGGELPIDLPIKWRRYTTGLNSLVINMALPNTLIVFTPNRQVSPGWRPEAKSW